ncbi:hypothetical protein Sgleb_44120 [Streptomyces glebosus]|uniref:Uncharacterized protein n=1 Tax=Streptomyces glebosus TaxID=249580 RepID=A0A640T417_9ACTN|nr:hypothetical protein Sgleb_44120 [Streptomyces glebosus]GHG64439.1 hypothetical protein GCM10010513_32470 [Streptomyces glebosus]
MKVHPFIEAEKRDGHNVKRACELLQVPKPPSITAAVAGPVRGRSAMPS